MTLLEKCNADVFKAILEIKEKQPPIGENLLAAFAKAQILVADGWRRNSPLCSTPAPRNLELQNPHLLPPF